jgi:hypothetical protein
LTHIKPPALLVRPYKVRPIRGENMVGSFSRKAPKGKEKEPMKDWQSL